MSRSPVLVVGAIWAIAVMSLVVLVGTGVVANAAQAYCTAWLLLVSFPLGALPVLMLLDLLGVGETSISRSLRLLLASLPILAVLIVPILIDHSEVYPHAVPAHGFAAHWYGREFFTIRAIAYLIVWIVLALFFVRREPPRPAFAGFGLVLHGVIGTLAAYDWFMSLDPGFNSSAYGILVIAAQCALALTAAALMALFIDRRTGPGRGIVLATIVTVAVATFVQFTEYLVIWSANLPTEIIWYQTRARDAIGPIFSIGGPVVLALAVIALLPDRFGMRRAPLTGALIGLLAVEVIDLILLASSGRGFTLVGVLVDAVFVTGIAGLAVVCSVVVAGRLSHGVRHG